MRTGLPTDGCLAWAFLAGLVALRCFGPVAGAAAAAAVLAGRVVRRPWQRRRALATYDDELVGLLRAVARGLRSGAVLRVALRDAATVARGPWRTTSPASPPTSTGAWSPPSLRGRRGGPVRRSASPPAASRSAMRPEG